MKRILGIFAAAGLLAATPAAFAGVDVYVDFGIPAAPLYAPSAPVYIAPAPVAYRHWVPRWHERHEYFERREFREHHPSRGDYRFHDYR
jgi:hypothetical protein